VTSIDQLSAPAARLALDPGFCGAFHRDPAAACRACTTHRLKAEARRIDRAHVPYGWGGATRAGE